MAKRGKKYRAAAAQVDAAKVHTVAEAVALIKKVAFAKFPESLNIDMRLGVDPRHADQQVRGTVILPHGVGKKVRVAVFAEGDDAEAARAAGADVVGGEDLADRVAKENFLDFDVAIATPPMMRVVGRLGKVLGPRGLMPNPKTGTVTKNVADAIREAKAGKVEFRVDRTGNIHNSVGRLTFDETKLAENVDTFIAAVKKAKPSASKGAYLRNISLSSTMGPGLKIEFVN